MGVVVHTVGVKPGCNEGWLSEVAALIHSDICVDSGVFYPPVLLRIQSVISVCFHVVSCNVGTSRLLLGVGICLGWGRGGVIGGLKLLCC